MRKKICSYVLSSLCSIYLVISGFVNLKKISDLENCGVVSKAVVQSFKLESNHVRYSTFYHASISYCLKETEEKGLCKFNFYPQNEYVENMEFLLIRDLENDFELPLDEIPAYKRVKVKGKFILAAVYVFLLVICEFVLDKVAASTNKKRKKEKKEARKNPELREKIKKREDRKTILLMILLSPFLLIVAIQALIKKHFKGKK